MLNRISPWLYRHPWPTFVLMGVSFALFGGLSLNLVYLLKANVSLFLESGIMLIEDGVVQQLLELLAYGYLSLAFFLLFKCCEHMLVKRLTKHPETGHGAGGPVPK